MFSGLDQPWCYQIQDVLGIFSDNDELFSYRNDFASLYGSGKTIVIHAGHRPPKEAFTDEIKNRIKKFLSYDSRFFGWFCHLLSSGYEIIAYQK